MLVRALNLKLRKEVAAGKIINSRKRSKHELLDELEELLLSRSR